MKRATADLFSLTELLAFQCASNIFRAHEARKDARYWHRKGEVSLANAYRHSAVTYIRFAKNRLAEFCKVKAAQAADAAARKRVAA